MEAEQHLGPSLHRWGPQGWGKIGREIGAVGGRAASGMQVASPWQGAAKRVTLAPALCAPENLGIMTPRLASATDEN